MLLFPAMTLVTVDRMRASDIAAVARIDRASDMGAAWDESALRSELEHAWSHSWVLRACNATRGGQEGAEGGAPNATATPMAFVISWLVQDELHVLNVATHPDFRRRGYARALVGCALEFARQHSVRLVLLEVRRSNEAALELYRSFGFAVTSVRARYYSNNEDAFEMALDLTDDNGDAGDR